MNEKGEILIEKDHKYLVTPTIQELYEIVVTLYRQREAAYEALGYRTAYK